MRSEANHASVWVVDGIVVHQEWHSKYVHWEIDWPDSKDAKIFVSVDREHVVFCINFEPIVIEHEEEARIIYLTLCVDKVIPELPFNSCWYLVHNFFD